MRRGGWLFFLTFIVAVAGFAVLLAIVISRREQRSADKVCASIEADAEAVRVGDLRFLCISADGRVVGRA